MRRFEGRTVVVSGAVWNYSLAKYQHPLSLDFGFAALARNQPLLDAIDSSLAVPRPPRIGERLRVPDLDDTG